MAKTECTHERNAAISLPTLSGRAAPDVCPFVWCRTCGAICIPRIPMFERAFETHARDAALMPVNTATIQAIWVHPGDLGIIVPRN